MPDVATGELAAPRSSEPRPTGPEVASWRGARLDESGGATAGRVEGWYVDELTGRPEWLVLRLGRFGRNALVPARDAVGAGGRVWVPYGRDLMRGAPRIEPYEVLDREAELILLRHYELGSVDDDRAAELAKRPAAAITARPGS